MPRPDQLYLDDILEAAGHIRDFLQGIDQNAFLASEILRSAVLQKLLVIGEAAARTSPDLKSGSPNIPWRKIVGLRNHAIHAYFSVDWHTVWESATRDVPRLAQQVHDLLATTEG